MEQFLGLQGINLSPIPWVELQWLGGLQFLLLPSCESLKETQLHAFDYLHMVLDYPRYRSFFMMINDIYWQFSMA